MLAAAFRSPPTRTPFQEPPRGGHCSRPAASSSAQSYEPPVPPPAHHHCGRCCPRVDRCRRPVAVHREPDLPPVPPPAAPRPGTLSSSVRPWTDQRARKPAAGQPACPACWLDLPALPVSQPFWGTTCRIITLGPPPTAGLAVPSISWNRVQYAPVIKLKSKENRPEGASYDQLLYHYEINTLARRSCDYSVTIVWINQRMGRMFQQASVTLRSRHVFGFRA
jgi:hypothetical protein